MSVDLFLKKLKSENTEEQHEAWLWADDFGSKAMPQLAELYTVDDQRLNRAAEEALDRAVHAVGANRTHPDRHAVVRQLINFINSNSHKLRVYGYRALSWVGEEDVTAEVVKAIDDPDVREEVVYCLERIPGPAADLALTTSLARADDSFKPRLIYAIGRRGIEHAAESLESYLNSNNSTIAIRALEALANIGIQPKSIPIKPDDLQYRDKVIYFDSLLRLADAQAKKNNIKEALGLFGSILELDEEANGEHYHCAAIVGLSKMQSHQAQKMIKQAQENAISYIVKDTAKRALES